MWDANRERIPNDVFQASADARMKPRTTGIVQVVGAEVRCRAAQCNRHVLSEHDHQVRFFLLVDYLKTNIPERADELEDVWATPNGGHRLPAVAGKLKAEGVRRGVPDITCMVPRGEFHAMVIELKNETGRPTPEQRRRLERLSRRGYAALCIRGWRDAARELCGYLGIAWQDQWVDLIEWRAQGARRNRNSRRRTTTRKKPS